MATSKKAQKKIGRRPVQKPNPAQPKYGFTTLFFIDVRAQRIVQGKVELINTIHKPLFDNEKRICGTEMNHYYSLRTEVYSHNENVHEDKLFTTHSAAAISLGKLTTDYLK